MSTSTTYGTNNPNVLDMIGKGVSDDTVFGYPKTGASDSDNNDNDTIYGWMGKDSLYGGTGGDTMFGEQDSDYLNGGTGNDTLWGGDGNDTIDGWTGNDVIHGESGDDYLLGWSGADTIYGEAGNDTLNGEGDNDKLYGGAGIDTMDGGSGSDHFYFGTQDSGDVFAGQADTIYNFKDEDTIFLKGSYTYAGNTSGPADGQYGIWQYNGAWVVTWNAVNDNGYHDVTVQGDNPAGDISFFA